ncbi:hypothetical protein ETA_29040 [Erwinia tasmaniensis Et1/99]|uniref:Uncharacterized protein n=1 Tax=Erwinia tasmaniensis (strain DSM 17950 / CFBP 7177 / CIP 109463 / NCPPB 4357 / Et1/99) TaxID=465817 RepID=B2VD06_ERWT9|nr:hypothetical protein ETA_29040 [Erwinia tasmaniensis Et1/99]
MSPAIHTMTFNGLFLSILLPHQIKSRKFPFPCQSISLYFPAQTSHAADLYRRLNIDNNSDLKL